MALTLEEFAAMNPSGSGQGHVNVLYKEEGGDFIVQAMTIPFSSKNGIYLRDALIEADTITFDLGIKNYTINVNSIQLKSSYYFINFEDFILEPESVPTEFNYNTIYGASNPYPMSVNSLFILSPYAPAGFRRSPYNVLRGNATTTRTSRYIWMVDRDKDQATPSNYEAILSGSASLASVQDSYYSSVGWASSRYEGTSIDSGSIYGDDPAQTLVSFKVSIHPSGSDLATLKDPPVGYNREVRSVYFNPKGSATSSNTFPLADNLLYLPEEDSNKFLRLINKSVYSLESNKVFTTDEFGKVVKIE